ncbi:MAG: tetratricopeptide repeat protein, partial [Pseudomonadota bacterium]
GKSDFTRPKLENWRLCFASDAPLRLKVMRYHAQRMVLLQLSVQQGWSTDHGRDSEAARAAAATAREINPACSIALTMDGLVHGTLLKDRERASALYDEAVSLNPNSALACLLKGTQYAFVDDGPSAVTWTRRARRLSPLDPQRYLFEALSSAACLADGDYESALAFADSSLRINRRHTSSLRARIVALQLLGRGDEARETTGDLMRREPDLTIERYLRTHPAADFETGRMWARALSEAGVPQR